MKKFSDIMILLCYAIVTATVVSEMWFQEPRKTIYVKSCNCVYSSHSGALPKN